MGEMRVKYYEVNGIVIKREFGKRIHDCCFDSGRWDEIIYWKSDPNDPTSVPVNVEEVSDSDWDNEISENMAMEIITDQTLAFLKEKWESDFAKRRDEWNKKPRWSAKLVETDFVLNGIKRSIVLQDLPELLRSVPWNEGFFESIQEDIETALKAYGATITGSWGFMD